MRRPRFRDARLPSRHATGALASAARTHVRQPLGACDPFRGASRHPFTDLIAPPRTDLDHTRPTRRSSCGPRGDDAQSRNACASEMGHEGVRLAGSSDPAVVPRAGRRRRHVPGLLPAGRTIGPRRAEPADPRADGARRPGGRRRVQDADHADRDLSIPPRDGRRSATAGSCRCGRSPSRPRPRPGSSAPGSTSGRSSAPAWPGSARAAAGGQPPAPSAPWPPSPWSTRATARERTVSTGPGRRRSSGWPPAGRPRRAGSGR